VNKPITAQQSRALASMMDRMPPAQRKQVQLDILSGMDERKAVIKAFGQQVTL
jgi:hypothetical protein